MGGPLFLHRLLFIFLNGLLAYRIANRLLIELEQSDEEPIEKYVFDWNDVNILKPPRLQSSLAERMRLNELLAVKNYDCKNKLQLGDENERYILCGEFEPFKSAASISGDKSATGVLERQISALNWIVFTPEGSQIVDQLSGDVEINYFTELEEWKSWHTWDMEQVLKGRRLDVAKFELYTPHFDSQDQPDVIKKLVPIMKAKQLLITIEPKIEDERIVWKWYNLLYWLFFEHHYALVGAVPNGVCGSNPRRCRYRVSLLKIDEGKMKSAPVFGMGSPLEEKMRLIKFINDGQGQCEMVKESAALPKFCLWNVQPKDTVVLVRHTAMQNETLPKELEQLEKVYIFSPDSPKKLSKDSHYSWFISSSNSTDSWYTLKSLDDVLLAVGSRINLLFLDIDGGEWELLPQLLSTSSNIQQIAIRGRIFPEENENYRLFYWQLYRLTRKEFKMKEGRVNDTFYSLVFKKE